MLVFEGAVKFDKVTVAVDGGKHWVKLPKEVWRETNDVKVAEDGKSCLYKFDILYLTKRKVSLAPREAKVEVLSNSELQLFKTGSGWIRRDKESDSWGSWYKIENLPSARELKKVRVPVKEVKL